MQTSFTVIYNTVWDIYTASEYNRKSLEKGSFYMTARFEQFRKKERDIMYL